MGTFPISAFEARKSAVSETVVFYALQHRRLILSTNGPGFWEPFLCPRTDRIEIGTTSATYCTARRRRRLNRLRCGISHTNMLRRQRSPDFNKSVPWEEP